MNEQFKKLSEEIKSQLVEHIRSKEFQDTIEAINKAQDSGTFEVVISTNDVDRQGEMVDQKGLDLTFYKQNPIVLWAHDYSSLPIGVADSIEQQDNKTIAKGRFAPTEFAQQVRKLYDLKMVRATSVGFIPKEMEGNIITKSELLEFSFVPVPANPHALSLAKSAELNVAELVTKGIMVKTEESADPGEQTQDAGKEPNQAEIIAPGAEPAQENGQPEAKTVEKAGRVLSEKNRQLIETTVSDLKKLTAALQELLDATNGQGDGGEDGSGGSSPKQRSSAAGSIVKQEFNEFLFMHEVLRSVNNATSSALEKYNAVKRK